MAKGWGELNTSSVNNAPKVSDSLDILSIGSIDSKGKKTKWLTVRFIGDVTSYAEHWINIVTKEGKKISISKRCLAYDSEKEEYIHNCPYCKLEGKKGKKRFLANVIVRDEQENEPRKAKKPSKEELKRGYRLKDDESWSPVKVLSIPSSLASKIQALIELNTYKIKDKKTGKVKLMSKSIEDPKYGADISISFDSTKKGGDMYNAQLSEKCPLTEEELNYLLYNLDLAIQETTDSEDVAIKEAKSLKSRLDKEFYKDNKGGSDDEDEEDDYDEDDGDDIVDDEFDEDKSKKSKSKSKSKKSKYDDDDDDEEDEDDEDEDEEDEDDYKSKKAKSKKKKSKYDEDEEDDDEEDDDEDEDDEDEEDDEEDEDDDYDEDEDEDDYKSKSKKSKKKSKK